MRLRSLELSDFRKFDRPVRLEGLHDGINVLGEPNEYGKSTMLAAIKGVLFEKHRAKNEAIKRMQHHRNATSPVVGLGFELPGRGTYHIEKRFMHREPYARLTLPDGSRLEGDVAEEHLQALLGFAAAGKQGSNADSIGLWGAMWVEQQAGSDQPILMESGRATLRACLEDEIGVLAGDGRSGAVQRQVAADLGMLLDGRDRPRGRYKEVGEQRAAVADEVQRLRDKRDSLQTAISELAQRRGALARASDADDGERLVADLYEARAHRDVIQQHTSRLRQAVTDLELVEQRHRGAIEETRRRADRVAAIAATERALAEAVTADAQASEALNKVEALLETRRAGMRAAEAVLAAAEQARHAANAVVSLASRSEQAGQLEQRLARATRAQEEVNRLTGELAANPAEETRMQALSAAITALERARSGLDARATEIEFDLEADASGRVQVGDTVLPAGKTSLRVVEDTAITVAGIGRVWVRPAIRDRSALQDKVAMAEAAVNQALTAVGAGSATEADAKAAARRAVETRLRAAEAALKAETPGDAGSGLRPGLEALRNHVAAGRSQLDAEMATLGLAALPTAAEAERSLQAADAGARTAADALNEARVALIEPQAEQVRAAGDRARAAAKVDDLRNTFGQLQREAAAAVATETDAALAERLTKAETAVAAQRVLVAQVQQNQPTETLENIDARITRLEQAGTGRLDTIRRLREEIVRLNTRVALEEGEGIDEQIAAAERQQGDLAAEQDGMARDVAVLTLLRDTLAGAERETRERYVAPVMRRMTPYLQGLFPGVEVGLSEELRITQLIRQAGAEEIERLSDGTREQVAVLLRLAYADLLLERGKPAMLILDDALAYSDPDRLELMFDLLTRAASRMQILVLTCRVNAFARLGGNRVRLVAA